MYFPGPYLDPEAPLAPEFPDRAFPLGFFLPAIQRSIKSNSDTKRVSEKETLDRKGKIKPGIELGVECKLGLQSTKEPPETNTDPAEKLDGALDLDLDLLKCFFLAPPAMADWVWDLWVQFSGRVWANTEKLDSGDLLTKQLRPEIAAITQLYLLRLRSHRRLRYNPDEQQAQVY